MKIVHDKDVKRFIGYDNDGKTIIGELTYAVGEDNEIHATNTRVFPGYEGHGYAAQLVDALVAFAEEEHANIVPICSYIRAAFEKNPEKYKAVIKNE